MRENERKEVIPTLKTVPIKEDVSDERMGLPQANIESGNTVSFMDSDGSMFYVTGGTTVSFSVELDRSAPVPVITGFTLPIHLQVPYR